MTLRHRFAIPADVTYLNAAANGPITADVRDAGLAGVVGKEAPWANEHGPLAAEQARAAASRLIGARTRDIAIVGSVAYALSIAGKNAGLRSGQRTLRMAGDHPSNALEWQRLAEQIGTHDEIVARPADGDWTAAFAGAIERPGAAPLGAVTLAPLYWADGAILDVAALAPLIRARGGALVIDATQAVGALPVSVAAWQPDFLAFPTYKWLLGPYNLTFLYVAPHRQIGEPLERNTFNWQLAEPASASVPRDGATRYDMGERNNPVTLPMAVAAMALLEELGGPGAVQAHAGALTLYLASALEQRGIPVMPSRFRSAHMLSFLPPGKDATTLVRDLAERKIFVSSRVGQVRVSPHWYNDKSDIDRLIEAINV